MVKLLHTFEKGVMLALIIMLAVIIVLSTINLGVIIVQDIIRNPYYLFDINEVLHLLGILIVVIIAVELLETAHIYFDETAVRIEVVFQIAMMSLAREVIVLNLHETPGITLVGIAAIAVALSLGYFLVRRRSAGEGTLAAPGNEKAEKAGPAH